MTEERWRRLSEWPMATAAGMFLAAYAWLVLAQPADGTARVGEAVMVLTWVSPRSATAISPPSRPPAG
ncbi:MULTISPECIES: hypothetical protein [Rhodococcus]|uniref:hypothetical protein n=1 Tax=Rhodococcus TaxID=1827 RepID=UPI0006853E32|nr:MULTISPECIES: hypothetical protein [Rhodococcus]ANZ24631.1 hypothetical protein A4U64_07870 [Rhodococcus sp. WB1]